MNNNKNAMRVAVKIGTSTLTHPSGRLNLRRIERLVMVLSDLRGEGHEIVLISSGAVSAGISRLGLDHRPRSVAEKQSVAAVGQIELMGLYARLFTTYGHAVGQMLLTRDAVDIPMRRESAESTFAQLLALGCIPIVNENDSVSVEEIQFGGNDTLSACVAVISHSDILVNLTDIDGLYDCDPRANKNARLVPVVEKVDDSVFAMAGGAGSERGTGGMITKLKAARYATEAGIPMIITNGRDPSVLYDIVSGNMPGTYFKAQL